MIPAGHDARVYLGDAFCATRSASAEAVVLGRPGPCIGGSRHHYAARKHLFSARQKGLTVCKKRCSASGERSRGYDGGT